MEKIGEIRSGVTPPEHPDNVARMQMLKDAQTRTEDELSSHLSKRAADVAASSLAKEHEDQK